MRTYTFFIRSNDPSELTTYITSAEGRTLDSARKRALRDCAAGWDCKVSDLWVQGIAPGVVDLIDWNDEGGC